MTSEPPALKYGPVLCSCSVYSLELPLTGLLLVFVKLMSYLQKIVSVNIMEVPVQIIY